ncbi:MAG: CDGSH iron-sulfur domain-containing protein [Methanobacteriaceae archaeon]|nr:CDGSH iron-sulfur domain-containing protein [Candidatus Methanorudis spinitermitis]
MKVKILSNGPYIVTGNIPLYKIVMVSDEKGHATKFKKKETISHSSKYSLCRCGNSKNKPFCDGIHAHSDFNGEEIASKNIYKEKTRIFETDRYKLIDAIELCDHSRFCLREGGIRNLIKKGDFKSIAIAKKEAALCPSGRLLLWDKEKNISTEKTFDKEIVLIYDDEMNCEGPIWLKGKIPLESSNQELYEIRNRVTLCRCGKSKNKPFCDGNHWMDPEIEEKFRKKWDLD